VMLPAPGKKGKTGEEESPGEEHVWEREPVLGSYSWAWHGLLRPFVEVHIFIYSSSMALERLTDNIDGMQERVSGSNIFQVYNDGSSRLDSLWRKRSLLVPFEGRSEGVVMVKFSQGLDVVF